MSFFQRKPAAWHEGYRAFEKGEKLEDCPFYRVSRERNGVTRAAWWEAGWNSARRGLPRFSR